jgi:hypothetical protein
MLEITLKTSADNQVIRKIVNPTVQVDLAHDNLFLNGQEELTLLDGQTVTTPASALFNNNLAPSPTTEQQAAQTAKQAAKEAALTAIKDALTTYAQACYAIEHPGEEEV